MIRIENIYYMLAYAFRSIGAVGFKDFSHESFDNCADLLAAILSKGVTLQIKRGMLKDYIGVIDDLKMPKGRIDLSSTLSRRIHLKKQVVCQYDEYSINTQMNQILKATMLVLVRSPEVKYSHKNSLKKSLVFFEAVDDINIRSIKWHNISFNKHNIGYRFLINICYLILNAMILRDEDGKLRFKSFIDDQHLSRLYEKFVLEYFKSHYPEFKGSASYVDWNVDDDFLDLLPRMKTDISLEYKGKILIIDTKYYASALQKNYFSENKTLHSQNIYQIFTYVKNQDINLSGNVLGMLLYAKTEEDFAINQKYEMSGNRIYVRTLDLDNDFMSIKSQLDDIGEILLTG